MHRGPAPRCAGPDHGPRGDITGATSVDGMRGLLVVNPVASAATARTRDVLLRALAGTLKSEVAETEHRWHAAELAEDARRDGLDVVVALGGDGTVNEVVNGLLADGVEAAPALAVVPGGSANVFARALGIPRDPVEATAELLRALAAGRSHRVGLGRADERWFTFNAGLGWDAEVVAAVDRARGKGREASTARYTRTAAVQYLRQRRRTPRLTVALPGEQPQADLALALVCNTDPWTYFGRRPLRTNPGASFDNGLSLFALRNLQLGTVLPTVIRVFRRNGSPRGDNVLRRDAVPLIAVHSEQPVGLQLDGDYLGERRAIEFRAVPEALRVVV